MGNDFEILHPRSRNYDRRTHHQGAAAGWGIGVDWVGCKLTEQFSNVLLKSGDQDISLGDFIGLAFVTTLEDMARDIALIELDPVDWGGDYPVTTRSTSVLLPLHFNPHLLAIGS